MFPARGAQPGAAAAGGERGPPAHCRVPPPPAGQHPLLTRPTAAPLRGTGWRRQGAHGGWRGGVAAEPRWVPRRGWEDTEMGTPWAPQPCPEHPFPVRDAGAATAGTFHGGDLGKPRPAGSSRRPWEDEVATGQAVQGTAKAKSLSHAGVQAEPPPVQLSMSPHMCLSPTQPRIPLRRWDSGWPWDGCPPGLAVAPTGFRCCLGAVPPSPCGFGQREGRS